MKKLETRNGDKYVEERIKSKLPEIVTGMCPVCDVNLFGDEKLPLTLAKEDKLYCGIGAFRHKTCPYE
tara:strand:- start:68 stop:271 length:204 start_codon:yes stop_codon:yes gene_type:complete